VVSLRAAADTVLSVLLAPPCAICERMLPHPLDGAVCETCWAAILPHPCRSPLQTIPMMSAIGPYESTLRDAIHALKYDGRRSIAPRLGRLMAQCGHEVVRGADVAVPVPLHWRRLRQRGFNQADDLARSIGLPVARVLRRIRATAPQVELPADARLHNVRDAFAWKNAPRVFARSWVTVTGLVVVLVDDVATTGATLDACARVLKAAGAGEVRAITAARVEHARRP
jgi:ComF family protein